MNKIISQTENGQIYRCSTCNLIHFEFKNLNFNFSEDEYKHFVDYFLKLEGEYWEIKNGNSYFRRKIFIPAGDSFNILLNNEELLELKELFSKPFKKPKIDQYLFNHHFSNN